MIEDFLEGARELAAQCWCDEKTSWKLMDPDLAESFAVRLAAWMKTAADNSKRADDAEAKLAFLKTKGLTVGVAKDAGKDPYLAFFIEPGSALCDRETLSKLIDAEIAAKNWEDTAAQNQRNADFWRGILQNCYEQLPEQMKRRARFNDEHEQLAKELSELCDKISFDEQVDFLGFNVAELRDMLQNPEAFVMAADFNAGQEVQAEAFGAESSAKWHKERGAFMKSRADELEAKI